MRKNQSILCLFALLTTVGSAFADEAPKFQWGGSARTRAEYDYFTNYLNVRQMAWMRFRPNFSVEAENGVNVYFEPQFAKAMGENTVSANSTTGTSEQNSGVTSDSALGVHQAYLNYSTSPGFQIRAGRQILSYGDELVVGALEWNNVGRAFDGFRIRHESETQKLDLFATKLVDTNVAGSGNGDYNFLGSYNSFKKLFGIDETDLYALYLLDARGTGPDPLQLWSIGFRVKSKMESIDYRLETTQQLGRVAGSTAHARGTQADVELGYRFQSTRLFRVGVEGFYADSDYNQLFPTLHKWLGTADVFGRRNIYGMKLNAITQLNDRLKLTTDFHRFYRADKNDPAYRINGTAITGSNVGDAYLGTEVDVTTQYDLSVHTSFQVGAAYLVAGQTLKDIHSKNPLFGYASWEVKF